MSWLKLHRSILSNDLWLAERFSKGQAWIDLLGLATFSEKKIFIRGIEIHLKRGELCVSQKNLALRWKWNYRTVNKFLKWLEKEEMIQTKINDVTTIITIINWDEYQNDTNQSADQNTYQSANQDTNQSTDQSANNIRKIRMYKERKEGKELIAKEKKSFSLEYTKEQEHKNSLDYKNNFDSVSATVKFMNSNYAEIDYFIDTFCEINNCDEDIAFDYYGKFVTWKNGDVKLTNVGWKEQFAKWYQKDNLKPIIKRLDIV